MGTGQLGRWKISEKAFLSKKQLNHLVTVLREKSFEGKLTAFGREIMFGLRSCFFDLYFARFGDGGAGRIFPAG